MFVKKTSVPSRACLLACPQRAASLLPPRPSMDNSHRAVWSRNKGNPRSLDILLHKLPHANRTPLSVPACPSAEPAGGLCCLLWEQSVALSFHLHFNCSAWAQVLQQPFGKYLLESGLISSMRVYAVKRCPKPMREVREEPKYLYHFKKVPPPRPLNLDYCLPLHFMPDVTAISREVGWEKGIPVWGVGIYFLSRSVQLAWPPQYILRFSTSQAWCLNLNSTERTESLRLSLWMTEFSSLGHQTREDIRKFHAQEDQHLY